MTELVPGFGQLGLQNDGLAISRLGAAPVLLVREGESFIVLRLAAHGRCRFGLRLRRRQLAAAGSPDRTGETQHAQCDGDRSLHDALLLGLCSFDHVYRCFATRGIYTTMMSRRQMLQLGTIGA